MLCAGVVGTGHLLTHGLAPSIGARDDDLARWFAARRTPGLDALAKIGTFVGDTVVGVVVLSVLGVAFARAGRSWRPLVLVLVSHAGLFAVYLTEVPTSLVCASLWLSVTGLLLLGGRPAAAD